MSCVNKIVSTTMSFVNGILQVWSKFRSDLNQLPTFVLILVSLYGLSSYVSMSSVLVEMPLFVNALPGGWTLPTHLIFFIQFASLAPALYVLSKKYFPDKIQEWATSIFLLVLGVINCPLLAIFWNRTVSISGQSVSFPLYFLAALIAVSDSTAQVVFLPYMSPFRPAYITALYFGKSLGGIVTGFFGMLQGLGKAPFCANATYYSYFNHSWITELTEVYPASSISVSAFYWIMEFILILSMIFFILFQFHPIGIQERNKYMTTRDRVDQSQSVSTSGLESQESVHKDSSNDESKPINESFKTPVTKHVETLAKLKDRDDYKYDEVEEELPETDQGRKELSEESASDKWKSVPLKSESGSSEGSKTNLAEARSADKISTYLNLIVLIACFFSFGLLPSFMPYTCLPYSQSTFNYTARLTVLICPFVSLIGVLQPVKSTKNITILFAVGLIAGIYQLILSFTSPSPPLQHSWFGSFLAVTTFILMDAVFNYVLLCCASRLSEDYGHVGLSWCSSMTQLGCFTGSLTALLIVDAFQWLNAKTLCADTIRSMQTSRNVIVLSTLHMD